MKKKILIGSIIAVVILVFASFSSVVGKVASDNELVEFNVEFCGLGKKHTVKLTQEEADEVELLFDDIEQRLSEVETKEEAEEIFKDAIVELDKYGLLGGLSVRQAQKIITGRFWNQNFVKSVEALSIGTHVSNNINENYFCLLAGRTNCTYFPSHFQTVVDTISKPFFTLWFRLYDNNRFFLFYLLGIIGEPLLILNDLSNIWTMLLENEYNLPILPIMKRIHLGFRYSDIEDTYSPACGWLYSFGLNGKMSLNGSFYGNIKMFSSSWLGFDLEFLPAVFGFTGLRIKNDFDTLDMTYLGTALGVKVSSEPPEF